MICPSKLSRALLLPLLLSLTVSLAACGGDDPSAPAPAEPIDADTVNAFVDDLPDWQVPDDTEVEPQILEEEEDFDGSAYVRCETVEYDRKRNFDNLVAVGANSAALRPGMLVQGRGVRDGAMSVIGLRRSPLSLSIDLALENPSRRVEDPNSASIQDAIASLQREADTRLGNLDVIPAQISFQAKEAYSYEQAMLDVGMSVKYNAVLASGSVAGSIRQSSQSETHTVIVKIFQPMYTISFADDQLAEPVDFFHPDLGQDDFQRQVELGTMGPDNQPCYVQTLTYGRLVLYSASSSEVRSAEELKLAMQASYGAWEVGGTVDSESEEIVRNSSIEVQVFGGTQEQGTNAIKQALRDGDYSAFLEPVPATTAVPLSYRINDMKNRQAAVVGDATTYSIQTCEQYTDLRFTVTLDRIEIVNGGEAEETFDIESQVSADGNWYWLMHNEGHRFTREELAAGGQTAIFEFNATPESEMEFYVADFGNGSTGRNGWSRNKTLDFPFMFDSNPYTFSIFETTTDDNYKNTTLEVFFTVERELIVIE